MRFEASSSTVLTTVATVGVMLGTVSWGAAGGGVQVLQTVVGGGVVYQSAGFAAP